MGAEGELFAESMLESDENSHPQLILACNLAAIPADQREAHNQTTRALFTSVQEVRDLPDGYAFRLPTTNDALLQASTFVANERLCCPFIGFTIEVAAQEGGMWLKLTGVDEVKEFLRAEFVSQLPA